MDVDIKHTLVGDHAIVSQIRVIRGEKVLLDADLARLYGVPTKRLNEAVRRNAGRFPEDFMFQLSSDEMGNLRSQIATSSSYGGRRSLPYAFTEQGVAMLSSVLRSPRAVAVNVEIMRAFVRIRRLLLTHAELQKRIDQLESKYDGQFRAVFDALRAMMQPPESPPKHPIGFQTEEKTRRSRKD